MVLAIDFDGTIVEDSRPYDDVVTPLSFKPGAKVALYELKKAGHTIILWSARASPVLLFDPSLDPLVRAGIKKLDLERWKKKAPIHLARYQQMVDFVTKELPGVFDAIDNGEAGKLPGVDLFIDDKTLRLGRGATGFNWDQIANMLGERVFEEIG